MNEEAIYAVLLMLGFVAPQDPHDSWLRHPRCPLGGVQVKAHYVLMGATLRGEIEHVLGPLGGKIDVDGRLFGVDEFVELWGNYCERTN